jgi:hypothetical protein
VLARSSIRGRRCSSRSRESAWECDRAADGSERHRARPRRESAAAAPATPGPGPRDSRRAALKDVPTSTGAQASSSRMDCGCQSSSPSGPRASRPAAARWVPVETQVGNVLPIESSRRHTTGNHFRPSEPGTSPATPRHGG